VHVDCPLSQPFPDFLRCEPASGQVGEEIKLSEEWVYKHQGFKEKKKIVFDEPKTVDIRADVDDLAKYLLRMLSEDDMRDEMGRAAREHAVNNFDYLKTSSDIAQIIEKKLGADMGLPPMPRLQKIPIRQLSHKR